MQKRISVLGRILFVLLAIPTLGTMLSSSFGYVFQLSNIAAHGILTDAAAICIVWMSAFVEGPNTEGDKLLFAVFAPLSLACASSHVFKYGGPFSIICALLYIGCCLYLSICYGVPRATGIITAVLIVLLLFPPVSFFVLMGNIGEDTVVRTVDSPSGEYYAEIIDSDQGALGGDTLVVVHESREFYALIFKISKESQIVYTGPWGEFNSIDVHWEDDQHLAVKSRTYEIK